VHTSPELDGHCHNGGAPLPFFTLLVGSLQYEKAIRSRRCGVDAD
jgi:hypothetical protein